MEQYERLRQYNRWLRGEEDWAPEERGPDPKELGELIDGAADRLEVLEREHQQFFEPLIDFARKIEAAAREKYSADTARIDFLEKNNPGRFGDISGPDVFAVMFRLVEPPRETLREAIDAAMAAESTT